MTGQFLDIERLLGLEKKVVGVRLLPSDSHPVSAMGLRYCEALLKAADGRNLVFEGSGSLCHASDVALGVSGPKYADIQPRVSEKVSQVLVAPLSGWPFKEKPEVVLVVCDPSQAMHMANALSYRMAHIDGNIAVCGLTAYTTLTGKPSLSLLCGSCRLYAGVRNNELALSFSFSDLLKVRHGLARMEAVRTVRIGELELTPSSRLTLKILSERGRSTQGELVRASGLSVRAVRYALKELSGGGVVWECRDFTDKRKRVYELSPRRGSL